MAKLVAGLAVMFVGLVMFVLLSPFVIVQTGHRGVVTHFGTVKPVVLEEGFHWINPFDGVTQIDVRTQTVTFDKNEGTSNLGAASKDLQDVSISFVVSFHPNPEQVNDIYQLFGASYEENILSPIIRETVKEVSARYTAEELVTKRAEVSAVMETALREQFVEKLTILENASIVNFQFSDSFNAAIEAKVTAEQNALASKNLLAQKKYEAEQLVVTATAEAESIRIQAEAVQAQGGREYIDLVAVHAWDGKLPVYMTEGAPLPFLNIGE